MNIYNICLSVRLMPLTSGSAVRRRARTGGAVESLLRSPACNHLLYHSGIFLSARGFPNAGAVGLRAVAGEERRAGYWVAAKGAGRFDRAGERLAGQCGLAGGMAHLRAMPVPNPGLIEQARRRGH